MADNRQHKPYRLCQTTLINLNGGTLATQTQGEA